MDRNSNDLDNRNKWDDYDKRPQPWGPMVNIIFGGPTAAETSRNSWKAYEREVLQVVGDPPKKAKTGMEISFDDNDLVGIKFLHDDPPLIIPVIGNSSVKRILIDGGEYVDIQFHEAFFKIGYNDS